MARKGIAPLSTTIALAFTSGSSTTSQRPTPKKITTARSSPLAATTEKVRKVRERGPETTEKLPGSVIWEPAHAIPPRRSGQSALPCLIRSSALLNDAALLNSQCVHGRNRCCAVCGNDGREK